MIELLYAAAAFVAVRLAAKLIGLDPTLGSLADWLRGLVGLAPVNDQPVTSEVTIA